MPFPGDHNAHYLRLCLLINKNLVYPFSWCFNEARAAPREALSFQCEKPLEASSNPSHLFHLHSENFAPPSFFSFLSVLPLQMNVLLLFSFMYSAFSQSTLGNMCFFVSLVSIFFLVFTFFFYRFKLVNTHFFWFQLLFCIIFTDVLTLIFHASSTLIFRTVFFFQSRFPLVHF